MIALVGAARGHQGVGAQDALEPLARAAAPAHLARRAARAGRRARVRGHRAGGRLRRDPAAAGHRAGARPRRCRCSRPPVLLVLAEGRDRDSAARQLASGAAAVGEHDAQVIVAGFGRVGRGGRAPARGQRGEGLGHRQQPGPLRRVPARWTWPGSTATRCARSWCAPRARRGRSRSSWRSTNAERAAELVRRVRREHPHLVVVARAVDRDERRRLLGLGADRVHRETFESALLMGEDALQSVGRGRGRRARR